MNAGISSPAAVQLLRRSDSVLVCIDLQERLMPVIAGGADMIERTRRLIVAARELAIPVFLTEQVPLKLGATVPVIREAASGVVTLPKAAFSACAASVPPMTSTPASAPASVASDPDHCTLPTELRRLNRPQLILTGVETHVCVLQTALGALAQGYAVFLVEDAVGSRDPAHKQNALRRIERAGGVIVNHESVLFEWLEKATAPEFRTLSRLVK